MARRPALTHRQPHLAIDNIAPLSAGELLRFVGHQTSSIPISAHALVLCRPGTHHSHNLLVFIVKGCGHHHEHPSRLLYSTYADEVGRYGLRAKVLTGRTPSCKLYSERVRPLLTNIRVNHLHEKSLPSLGAICVVHSCAVNYRPVSNYRIPLIATFLG